MRVVELRGAGYAGLVEDRYALIGGRIVDVRAREPATVLELDGVVGGRVRGSTIVVHDGAHVRRIRRVGARWEQDAPAPAGPVAAISRSGRFVFVDAPDPRIVDLDTGAVHPTPPPALSTSRPCFDVLPDGREVLFVSAPSYMAIRMIDAATGAVLRAVEPADAWSFCHTHYALTPRLLVTSGCVWAGPFEARCYDATSWTLVRRIEPLDNDHDLERTDLAADGAITSVEVATRANLLADEDGDRPSALDRLEPGLLARIDAIDSDERDLLLLRAIDPATASTTAIALHPIPQIRSNRIHHADAHRVAVLGPRLRMYDIVRDRVDDHGPLAVEDQASTGITRDGAIAVIVRP